MKLIMIVEHEMSNFLFQFSLFLEKATQRRALYLLMNDFKDCDIRRK
jgi:hypothetical protein